MKRTSLLSCLLFPIAAVIGFSFVHDFTEVGLLLAHAVSSLWAGIVVVFVALTVLLHIFLSVAAGGLAGTVMIGPDIKEGAFSPRNKICLFVTLICVATVLMLTHIIPVLMAVIAFRFIFHAQENKIIKRRGPSGAFLGGIALILIIGAYAVIT